MWLASTDFTKSAKNGSVSVFGRRSRTASTACPSPPSLTTKSFAVTAGCHPTCNRWNRSGASCGRRTSPTRDCFVTCCGPTPTRTFKDGVKTIAEYRSRSALTLWPSFWIVTTWTWFVALIRSSRTDMSSSPKGNSSRFSPRPITAENSTTLEVKRLLQCELQITEIGITEIEKYHRITEIKKKDKTTY